MKDRQDPRAVDLTALCRQAATLQGEWPQAGMARLAASLAASGPQAAPVVWSATGELRPVAGGEAEIWLHLKAATTVALQCQRCLQPMTEPLRVDRRLRFVRGEAEAARLDEDSEDDVLQLPQRLDLHDLVEDELILALPLVPRHARCPLPLPMPADEMPASAPAPKPFAGLAALRRRGPGPDEGGGPTGS
ncbi:MAG TPA: DUF177 domain-containing protein [Rubrivivax sp.]|nr:DUF177 domain-containing protein [Rubrivivax sp.]